MPKIHGWAYDVETGLLQDLNVDFKVRCRRGGMLLVPATAAAAAGSLIDGVVVILLLLTVVLPLLFNMQWCRSLL